MQWWAEVSGADVAQRPRSVVLVLTNDGLGEGFWVTGYDPDGRETTSTWHGGRSDAEIWASSEHAPADVGPWREIPAETSNAVGYALQMAGHPSGRALRARDIREH